MHINKFGDVLATGKKSPNCLEEGLIPAADSYLCLQSIYNPCLEEVYMTQLCLCGCGQAVHSGNWIRGHWNCRRNGSKHPMFGKIPYNKGKRGVSLETSKKMSNNHANISGALNPNYGNNWNEEQKKRMSNLNKWKTPWNKGLNKEKDARIKKYGESIAKKWRETGYPRSGENSYMWRGGISYEPYCPKFNNNLKEEIRNKYGRKCVLCKKPEKENDKKLHIHHIDYDKQQGCNGKKWGLVPLCTSCHMKTNGKREYYNNVFINIIEGG